MAKPRAEFKDWNPLEEGVAFVEITDTTPPFAYRTYRERDNMPEIQGSRGIKRYCITHAIAVYEFIKVDEFTCNKRKHKIN